jgi:hypothetical protein
VQLVEIDSSRIVVELEPIRKLASHRIAAIARDADIRDGEPRDDTA